MIEFRYHVIAVAAVFAAVAIGLVGGALVRPDPVATSAPPADVVAENATMRDRIAQLDADVGAREAFAEQLARSVLSARLTGVRVLVLSTPAGVPYVDSIARLVVSGGAVVTGRVGLNDSFTDPANSVKLVDLATTSLPLSFGSGLPPVADGVTASSALLAGVLMRRTPALTAEDARSVLVAYSALGYLDVGVGVTGPADAVVIVSGPVDEERAAATLSLVSRFDQVGSVVVVGPDAKPEALVSRVRAQSELATTVSTVDNVATPSGRLVAVWAVADQLGGSVGHYGTGTGLTLMPSLLIAPDRGPESSEPPVSGSPQPTTTP